MMLAQMDNELTDGEKIIRWLRDNYTEDKADQINAVLVGWIPDVSVKIWFIPLPMGTIRAAAAAILDRMTPERAIQALEDAFQKVGWVRSDRRLAWPGS